jgi:quinol monooxygenase YgiN
MLRPLALAGLAETLQGSPMALAHNATIYTVTYIEVARNAGRKDDGNFGLEVLQRIEYANQFAVLSAWVDQKAFEAHWAQAHSKTMQEKIAAISAAPSDTRQHQALSVAPAKSGRDALFAVTHVDVIPPQKDNGAAALKQLAEDSRQHFGNLEFDVWQQTNRPNHFTVVEAWGSRGALNVHVMQKETREFRIKLAPMSGALYDKRLYKVLR